MIFNKYDKSGKTVKEITANIISATKFRFDLLLTISAVDTPQIFNIERPAETDKIGPSETICDSVVYKDTMEPQSAVNIMMEIKSTKNETTVATIDKTVIVFFDFNGLLSQNFFDILIPHVIKLKEEQRPAKFSENESIDFVEPNAARVLSPI